MKSREDWHTLTPEELKDKLTAALEEYENLQLQKATHQITNPMRIRIVRRNVARLRTYIRQHELGIAAKKQINE